MSTTISQSARIRLTLRYFGGGFHGWARQPGLRTVQDELEAALEQILRIPVELTVAGRTDAGVHAAHQVAHFDLPESVWSRVPGRSQISPERALVRRLNAVLARSYASAQPGEPLLAPAPKGYCDVVVTAAEVVPAQFDARFSALGRSYEYRIADGVGNWLPQRRDVLWLSHQVDLERMNLAAQPLLGEHDFLSFCKPREGASTVRTLREIEFSRDEQGLIVACVRADAFGHSQVRSMVGCLLEVGRGRRNVAWLAELLDAQSRNAGVVVAPAHGLTLASVEYPRPEEYGTQAQRARRYRGQ